MKVSIQDFEPLHDLDVEFRPGLNIIVGDNGAGKSRLLESFLWAIYGDARGRVEEAKVEASLGDVMALRQTQGGKTNVELRLGEKRITGVRDSLQALSDASQPGLRDMLMTCWAKQGEVGFIGLSALERRRLLAELLELERWEKARLKVAEKAKTLNTKVLQKSGHLTSLETLTEQKRNVASLLEPETVLARTTPEPAAPVVVDQAEINKLENLIASSEQARESITGLEARFCVLPISTEEDFAEEQNSINKLSQEFNESSALVVKLKDEIKRIAEAQKVLESIPCRETDFPKSCMFVKNAANMSLTTADRSRNLRNAVSATERLGDELQARRTALSERRLRSAEAQRQRSELSREILTAQNQAERIPEYQERLDKLQKVSGEDTREALTHWKASHANLIRFQAVQEEIAALEQQLPEQRAELKQKESLLQSYKQLEKDFSAKGVPGYVIEGALPDLADNANQFLGKFNPDYALRFSITKPKVSGGQAETLEVLVHRDGREVEVESCSGGERTLVDVAVRLALLNFMRKRGVKLPNMLVLDETLAALDEGNRARFIRTLSKVEGLEKIVLISHVQDLRDLPANIVAL